METKDIHELLKPIFNLLKYAFIILPMAAGLDKFTNILTNWEHYLNPKLALMLPMPASTFMMVVGVIEIIAGIIVLIRAEIGGYIVAAWLTAIAFTLLTGFIYLDVAVRDLVMAIAALSMARMARALEKIGVY